MNAFYSSQNLKKVVKFRKCRSACTEIRGGLTKLWLTLNIMQFSPVSISTVLVQSQYQRPVIKIRKETAMPKPLYQSSSLHSISLQAVSGSTTPIQRLPTLKNGAKIEYPLQGRPNTFIPGVFKVSEEGR
jgi:hypothetical protein